MNLARDHLRFQEIEWLAEGSRRGYATPGQEAQLDEIRHHLAECEPCQGLAQMHEDLQRRFGQLDAAAATARPAPDCPLETVWWGVAAGQLPDSQVTDLLEHSTHCDACGLLLRQAIQDFTEEVADQEIGCLTTLPSVQQEWQQSLAQRLVAARTEGGQAGNLMTVIGQWARSLTDRFAWHPRSAFRYAWAYATAAIVVLAAGVWFVQTRRQPSIDQLIASAYAERRPFELRIAGAAYGPVRQERSGERSALAEPADLLKAEYLIKEQLATRPNDQAMLVASGKVELLAGHYDEAIRTLGRMLDAQPDSPALLTDLATAYFQRAVATDRAVDYGQAIELLSRTLAKKPDDPVALFNRAITLQKMYAYSEATRDWEHYLRVDPKGDWADEARRRLGELQEKMKARDRPAALLQSDPVAALSLLQGRADSQSKSPWPASFDEEYLDLIVQQWLASLYVSADSSGQHVGRREQGVWDALTAAADVMRTRHKDPWLADLLHELPADSASPNTTEPFVKALDFLAQAARANASGDPDSARPLAELAARLFHTYKSDAGFLRAREEIIYSHVRAGRVQDCIQAAGRQLHETKLELYRWLQGQAVLWDATCQGFAGNLGLAQQLSDHALELTENTAYTGQHLRSILFASGFLRSTERNWQDIRTGLQKFWEDLHSPIHGYEFYSEMALLAEEAEYRHLALHLYREAVGLIEKTPDRSFRAFAHYNLAVAAMRIQDLSEAETEFKITEEQYAASSLSATGRFYRTLAEILWAAVAIQQGRLELAAARLEQARPLAVVSDSRNAFQYYQTLGELHFRRGKLLEAEQALRQALHIADVELASLRTEADRLAWEHDSAPAYRTFVELCVRKPDAIVALELWERYLAAPLRRPLSSLSLRNLDPANPDGEPRSPFLPRIKGTLPNLKHETVISFAYLPSGLAGWAFDDRGVRFAWITASTGELAGRIREFAHLCSDPYSDVTKLRQEGRDLYDLLVAPFERHLEPSRLLIVETDSILSDVPWPALVDPRGEYVGRRYAIVTSPGLGYWLNLRQPAAISPERSALVVGVPTITSVAASRFAPLPDADQEAQGVASHFRHSRLLFGAQVTSLTIRQELLHSEVFHFAGHAVSSVKESGLVLASLADPNGNADELTLFSASDLESTSLQRLQLVVLSACATAETEKGFTGPDTLVRGFLRAGVPHVVASRWPVDSRTTQQMMTEFYKSLFHGHSSTEALQEAANTLRLQSGTAHPYYWAAFGSYGR